jgi:Protein of unknown function (DUF3037)
MGLGAYSVVRYADDVSDQRINLGVLVWHPVDGFRCRLSPAIDRVQAIDPRVTVRPLKRQLEDIKESVTSAPAAEKELFAELCKNFSHGLVISSPYPAKISSADETLNRLYELLVSPTPEIRRASSQRTFENNLKKTIEVSLETGWPRGRIQKVGIKNVQGIPVNIGMRTQISHAGRAALWHPLSLQSETKAEAQMATAKATILDIFKTREIEQYKRDKQYVAVQAPRAKSASKFGEVISCLEHVADKVFVANDQVTLVNRVQQGLRALENGAEPRRTRAHA